MRHELTPREPKKFICFVGYDSTNRTYFVYVANKSETSQRGEVLRNNHVVVWLGTHPGEIRTVAELKSLISDYAELPAHIERALVTSAGEKVIEQGAQQ